MSEKFARGWNRRESYFIKTLLTSLPLIIKITCESSNQNNTSKPNQRLCNLVRTKVDYHYKDYTHILSRLIEIDSHVFLKMPKLALCTVNIYALQIFKLVIFSNCAVQYTCWEDFIHHSVETILTILYICVYVYKIIHIQMSANKLNFLGP